jgi:hypothetical protein
MKIDDITKHTGKDVTINIPITISIPAGGGMPQVGTAAPAGDDLPEEPVMVPPLQAELELQKQQGGKQSRVINQIVSDDGAASDDSSENDSVRRFWDLNEDYEDLVRQFDFLTEQSRPSSGR